MGLHGSARVRAGARPRVGARQRDDSGSRGDGWSVVGQHRGDRGTDSGSSSPWLQPNVRPRHRLPARRPTPRSLSKARPMSESRRMSSSASRVDLTRGPKSRSTYVTIDSSPSTFSVARRGHGCRRPSRSCRASTSSRSRTHAVSPISSLVTSTRALAIDPGACLQRAGNGAKLPLFPMRYGNVLGSYT